MTQADFIKVQKALSGVHYPAKKEDLLRRAKQHKAGGEVLQVPRKPPRRQYDGPAEVSSAAARER